MASAHPGSGDKSKDIFALAVGAIGVVYGDIGTSPLYAFREALHAVASDGGVVSRGEILGILSLILWSLTIIVTIKYVAVLLTIDNKGEGGTLALMALARSVIYRNTNIFLYLGIAGAALFYGDSMITPAISVLSAVEGLKVVTPAFEPFIIPITLVIIVCLFAVQSRGTASVSKVFGPVTVIWFSVMGIMGLTHIMDDPGVLLAISPWYGIQFLFGHGYISLITLGAVFLAVTGAEALYADLGHFGRAPIRGAWGWFVFPALMLNYLGQGALVLSNPETIDNPFFNLAPEAAQLPLVILATFATIIASQAVITGAFSLTRQAINLGLLPRMKIMHTSEQNSGQIYLPRINYLLMVGTIILVIIFKSSSALAATYGISVTGAMMVDAIMAFFVIWQLWEWKWPATVLLVGPFILIDGAFLGTNLMKIANGGWVPLMIAAVLILMMVTWIQGSFIISGRSRKRDIKLQKFISDYKTRYPGLVQVKGDAFFLSSDPLSVPASLMQNIRHNKVLHERSFILSIKMETVPYVAPDERVIIHKLSNDFTQVILRFGFKDDIDVQAELIKLNRDKNSGIDFNWGDTSLFLSRRSLRSIPQYGMPLWQDMIYVFMHRYASEPTDYYKLPIGRVIEIGRHVVI
jgi:KUP system potassium uptake protein